MLDSELHTKDSRFQPLDSKFFVSGTWIPDSLSYISESKAEDSRFHKQTFLDSGFHQQKFPRLWNTDSLFPYIKVLARSNAAFCRVQNYTPPDPPRGLHLHVEHPLVQPPIFLSCLLFQTTGNQNCKKILKSDWLATVLISALIGQYASCLSNCTVHATSCTST